MGPAGLTSGGRATIDACSHHRQTQTSRSYDAIARLRRLALYCSKSTNLDTKRSVHRILDFQRIERESAPVPDCASADKNFELVIRPAVLARFQSYHF